MAVESIQPVVLVGGRSRRFGRDKLREPWRGAEGGAWLVDQPRRVLEAVFGRPAWAAGDCDDAVASRFARVLADARPGLGPVGGVLAALDAAAGTIAVLAGDLPCIDRGSVRALRDAAEAHAAADAIVARSDRLEPCIAVYRACVARRWRAGFDPPEAAPGVPSCRADVRSDRREPSLQQRLGRLAFVEVPIDPRAAVNLNSLEDLRALRGAIDETARSSSADAPPGVVDSA